jgi:hypothetical protein
MSAHPSVEELASHAEGLLGEDDLRHLGAHLAGCAACQAVRADLAALSAVLAADRPGPMPADVAARLAAALASAAALAPAADSGPDVSVVRRRRRETAGEAPARDGQRTTPVDLATRRRARYRWYARVASAAAGLVLVVGGSVLGVQLARDAGMPSGASAGRGAERATGLAPSPESAPGPTVSGDGPVLMASGRNYTEAGFAAQVTGLLLTAGEVAGKDALAAPQGREAPTGGTAAAPPAAAAECAADLAARKGQPGVRPVAVDAGRWEGEPAVVVVLPEPGSAAAVHAYVLPRDCADAPAGTPTVLHDAVLPR